jgi:tRNA (cmo5U34)-methyltransferase
LGKNGFDRIAPFYDIVVTIFSGGAVARCRNYFLKDIPSDAEILLIGGGTAPEIDFLFKNRFTGKIVILDSSAGMLELAKERVKRKFPEHSDKCIFTCEDLRSYSPSGKFDVIITNFFLDLFTKSEIDIFIRKLAPSLKPGGIWLIADFSNTEVSGIKKHTFDFLLKLLYMIFFKVCSITGNKLPQWHEIMFSVGFKRVNRKTFFSGFLKAEYWKKTL